MVIGGKWDLSRNSMDLPDYVRDRILSTPVPDIDLEDFLIPTFVDHTGFSLAKVYSHLIAQPQMDLEWLWKSKTEPKIKIVLWLLCCDRIPHKALLALRKITPDSACPRCKHMYEDSIHVIRDYIFSVPV
ncbi:uncharacterized protein LOC125496659 [Beta vulgaris subsp. vulgaris]|uniref:uncharacterized protein LOC125496659 n=1 Tax=Beta vulgaris subsp. vulgaris TaxID=3555 RepID=UPI0020367164|nr:uncharacterized protein LOC125496659 [Beta vulgaris subsp. vulgaris]